MSISTKSGAVALVAALTVALPASAPAKGKGERSHGVPARIAAKLRAAERAVERAQVRVEDAETVEAAAALTAGRRHLASALSSAKRRLAIDGSTGPRSASAVGKTGHYVVGTTATLFDGQSGAVVDAVATTLDAAIASRDALVSAIVALDDRSGYDSTLERFDAAVAEESGDIADALADDELTGEARAALDGALAKLQETAAAIDAAVAPEAPEDDAGVVTFGDHDEHDDDDDADDDAPRAHKGGKRGRGHGGR